MHISGPGPGPRRDVPGYRTGVLRARLVRPAAWRMVISTPATAGPVLQSIHDFLNSDFCVP